MTLILNRVIITLLFYFLEHIILYKTQDIRVSLPELIPVPKEDPRSYFSLQHPTWYCDITLSTLLFRTLDNDITPV